MLKVAVMVMSSGSKVKKKMFKVNYYGEIVIILGMHVYLKQLNKIMSAFNNLPYAFSLQNTRRISHMGQNETLPFET